MAMNYLTTKQAAERLGVAVRTMQKWIVKGYFPNVEKLDPYAERPAYRIPEADEDLAYGIGLIVFLIIWIAFGPEIVP
jgi:excisionase family DNA binding protein